MNKPAPTFGINLARDEMVPMHDGNQGPHFSSLLCLTFQYCLIH
jgi:hypothetical protein